MACCHDDHCTADAPSNRRGWRRALWIALVINAGFFLAEIIAGVAAGSAALQADALDFFGDAANYAISLGVAGMVLTWRARAAIAKGGTLIAFALWVLGSTVWHTAHGTLPEAEVMGLIGFAALLANGGVAFMLYRFRGGDANMRSVWVCSRNDAIGNLAVLLAAMGASAPAPAGRIMSPHSWAGLVSGADSRLCTRRGVSCAVNVPHRSAWRRSRKPAAETPLVQPLTCCLSAGAYRNRIAWIESLTRRALEATR